MNNLADIATALTDKVVNFKTEIVDSNMNTVAEAGKGYILGNVQATQKREDTILLQMDVEGKIVNIYSYKSEKAFCEWVQTNFIPQA